MSWSPTNSRRAPRPPRLLRRLSIGLLLTSLLVCGLPLRGDAQALKWYWGGVDRYRLPAQNQMVLEIVDSHRQFNRPLDDLLDDGSFGPGNGPIEPDDFDLIWKRDFGALYEGAAPSPYFEVISPWQAVPLKPMGNAQLLHFPLPSASAMSSQPSPGDIVRVRQGGGGAKMLVMVWVGNGFFPHLKTTNAQLTSFFYYPFFSTYPFGSGGLATLQRNTWPPRISRPIANELTSQLDNFSVPQNGFRNDWLTTAIGSSANGDGAYGKYYVPIGQWMQSPASFQCQVLRRRGCYLRFSTAARNAADQDLRMAMEIAGRSADLLRGGNPAQESRVRDLLHKCFDLSGAQAAPGSAQRRRVANQFRSFREQMGRCCLAWSPGYVDVDFRAAVEPLLQAVYPNARLDDADPVKGASSQVLLKVSGLNAAQLTQLQSNASLQTQVQAAITNLAPSITTHQWERNTRNAFNNKNIRVILFVDRNHFNNPPRKRATTLIHEFCHASGMGGHPGTGDYGRHRSLIRNHYNNNALGPFVEHKMLRIGGGNAGAAQVLGDLGWPGARVNAYSYGNFALWLANSLGITP